MDESSRVATLEKRFVHRRFLALAYRPVAAVADNPDDFGRIRLLLRPGQQDLTPNWIESGKMACCEFLVDDDDSRGSGSIVDGEVTSSNQSDPHHRKVAGTDAVDFVLRPK